MKRTWLYWVLVAVLGVITVLRVVEVTRILQYAGLDLAQDYMAARHLLTGTPMYAVYTPEDVGLSSDTAARFAVHRSAHPPFVAWLIMPLSLLPFSVAAWIWTIITVGLVAWGWFMIAEGFNLTFQLPIHLLIIMLILNWEPVWLHLLYGQLNVLLWVVCLLSWRSMERQKDVRSGLWLGIAILIKLYPLLFLGYFALRRKWKAVITATAVVIGSVALDVALAHNNWYTFFVDVSPSNSKEWSTNIGNLSLMNLGRRVFGVIDKFPTLIQQPLGGWIIAGIGYCLVGFALWRLVQAQRLELRDVWATLTAAMILLSPITWDNGLIFLIMPCVMVLAYAQKRNAYTLFFGFLALMLIAGLPNRDFIVNLSQNEPALRPWWAALVIPIAYVPLLAFWATWYCVVKRERNDYGESR